MMGLRPSSERRTPIRIITNEIENVPRPCFPRNDETITDTPKVAAALIMLLAMYELVPLNIWVEFICQALFFAAPSESDHPLQTIRGVGKFHRQLLREP